MEFAHLGFAVTDLDQSKDFYSKALAPLGISFMRASDTSAHFGKGDGTTMLWIHTRGSVPGPFHIAFEAESLEQVQAFHEAALAAGAQDNGAPGIREQYSPTYYAAFVIDPNGHNLEAVFRS